MIANLDPGLKTVSMKVKSLQNQNSKKKRLQVLKLVPRPRMSGK
jgi:hypothetical protein